MDLQHIAKEINTFIESDKAAMRNFLREFIAISSETYKEKDAVAWYAEKLKEFGFEEVRIDPVGNCLGRIGTGKKVFLFDAHIDTVGPGSIEAWGFDPLKGKYEDGIVYGRGAVDDKACLTGFAFAGKALKSLQLTGDFTFWVSASVAEEDVEGSCVKAMMEEAGDLKPDFIVVGESSEMRIIRGHKGRALLKIDVTGKAAHASAAWRGENALIKALPLIEGIDTMDSFDEDPFLGKGSIEVTKVECDTPSLNTIPGKVTVFADRRISLGETKEELIAELKPLADSVGGKISIDVEKVTTYTGYEIEQVDYFPSWVIPEEHPLIQGGIQSFRTLFSREPVVGSWGFCTNATYLCGITGIPGIGFGPGDGSLCHSERDSVSVQEMADAAKFYASIPFFVEV